MAEQDVNKMMSKMRNSEANTRIKTSIGASRWTDEEKRKALLASRYLNSVSKGSNALELNVALMLIWRNQLQIEKSSTFPNILLTL